MSSTVSVGGFEITSTESAASMVDSLAPAKDDSPEPKILVDEGKEVQPKDAGLSKAAAELGKKGGEAAAAARKVAPIKDQPAKKEPAEEEDEGEKARKAASEEIEKAPPDQRKKLASDRVAEATRAAAEAKRALAQERIEKERLARELREARTQAPTRPSAAPAAAPAAQAQDDPKPIADQFETYEDFVEARARWAARQEFSEQAKQAAAEEARAEREHRIVGAMESFHGRVEKAIEADPEFLNDQTLAFMDSLKPSFMVPREDLGPKNVIADEILRSESAPALVDYFVKNPDAFQRIAALRSPREIQREMAKVEARLEGATAGTPPPKQEVSKANPPLRPVKGAPPAAEPDIYGDVDLDTYVKLRRARR